MKDNGVKRHSKTRCSYQCRYYQGGPVMSICNKYHKHLQYGGSIPPLMTQECLDSLKSENEDDRPT